MKIIIKTKKSLIRYTQKYFDYICLKMKKEIKFTKESKSFIQIQVCSKIFLFLYPLIDDLSKVSLAKIDESIVSICKGFREILLTSFIDITFFNNF